MIFSVLIANYRLVLAFITSFLSYSLVSSSESSIMMERSSLSSVSASSGLDICVGVVTDCSIHDENSNVMSCEQFSSQPFFTEQNCLRNVYVSSFVTNIFNRTVAMIYQVDGGVVSSVLKQPGEHHIIGPVQKQIDICNVDEIDIFNLWISSGWKEGESPLVKCEDTIVNLKLTLPFATNSPTTSTSQDARPTLNAPVAYHPQVYTSHHPSYTPTIPPLMSPSPSSTNVSDDAIDEPTMEPSDVFHISDLPTISSRPPVMDCSGTVVFLKSPSISPTNEETNTNHFPSVSPTYAATKKKSTKNPVVGKGKLQMKKKCKMGKAVKSTKSPKSKKSSKLPTSKKSSKKSCKHMGKSIISIPDHSKASVVYFGVEIYSHSDIPVHLNDTIVDGLNDVYRGSLLGCNDALRGTLANERIVSIEFQNLDIASGQDKIEGLEHLCKVIPAKYDGSRCYKASGSVELYRLLERRFLSDNAKEDNIMDLLKSILSTYAASAFEDVDVVSGLQYEAFSSHAYVLAPPSYDVWSISSFVGVVLIFLFGTVMFVQRRHRTSRKVVTALCNNFPVQTIDTVLSDDIWNQNVNGYDYSKICQVSTINEEELQRIQRRQLTREFHFPVVLKE